MAGARQVYSVSMLEMDAMNSRLSRDDPRLCRDEGRSGEGGSGEKGSGEGLLGLSLYV